MPYREVCKNGRGRILYGSKDLMNGFVEAVWYTVDCVRIRLMDAIFHLRIWKCIATKTFRSYWFPTRSDKQTQAVSRKKVIK